MKFLEKPNNRETESRPEVCWAKGMHRRGAVWGKERTSKPVMTASLHTRTTATVYKHLVEAAGGLGTDDIKPEGGR